MVYLNMRNGMSTKQRKLVKSYTLTAVEESTTKVHEERDLFICSADKVFPDFPYTVNYCRGLSGV